jgi:large conductance mechanosensitive channel
MVDLDDARDALVESGEVVEKQAKRFWNGFLDFALQDNVLEVAVGLM